MRELQTLEPRTDPPPIDTLLETLAQWREQIAELRAQYRALMRVIGRRGIALTPEQIDRIHTCRVRETLDLWLDRAVTAETAREILDD